MRRCGFHVCAQLVLMSLCLAQSPMAKGQTSGGKGPAGQSADAQTKNALEARIKAEWEAIKAKDRKAYGEMLADDFIGVEVDSQGTRTKQQIVSELERSNVKNYTLYGISVLPLGPNAAFTTYESTMEFYPKAQVRFWRVYIGELWVNNGGQWKLRHYQETHVR